ncbi:MAG TPA: ABC transporter permease [Anaerolineales bacterium]|nr:ABC transporter permease [Anaerolineales bacterium]
MNPYRRSPWIIASTILVFIFLYAPIVVLMTFAFNASRVNVLFTGIIPSFGDYQIVNGNVTQSPCGPFHWFCELSKNTAVLNAAKNTMIVAITATVVSTIIGTMAALALQRYNFRLRTFSQISLYIPIVIPEIVMGIIILVLFSQLFTSINNVLNLTGDARLNLGLGTVILSHISFMIPFVTLVVQARLQGLDKSYEEAAMDLGANEWTTFRRVTFPMILPGVLSGALLAFTLSIDDFIITFFTNGPGSTTLPIYVYGLLRRVITPELNALSTIWILIVLIAVFMIQRMENRQV